MYRLYRWIDYIRCMSVLICLTSCADGCFHSNKHCRATEAMFQDSKPFLHCGCNWMGHENAGLLDYCPDHIHIINIYIHNYNNRNIYIYMCVCIPISLRTDEEEQRWALQGHSTAWGLLSLQTSSVPQHVHGDSKSTGRTKLAGKVQGLA